MKFKSKYIKRMIVGGLAYVCGIWAWQYFALQHSHSLYRYWPILLPMMPFIYCAITFHHHITKEKDEMWRKIITESLAFSATATASTCVGYVFFRGMGAPEFQAEWAFYLLAAYYWIGAFFFWRRYR
jgi:hypothetical protein